MYKKLFLITIIIFSISKVFSQQYSDVQIKAALINKFVQNIQWEDEKKLDKFTIAICGQDTALLPYFRQIAATKNIKEKNTEVVWFSGYSKLVEPYPQLIFIPESNNNELEEVFDKIQYENVLLVSDEFDDQRFVMINFIYKDDKSISFEVNSKTIDDQNLTILPKLLLLGGTEIDVRELYKQQEEELKLEKEKVENQQKEIEEQKALITLQQQEVKAQQEVIDIQKEDIQKQKDTLLQVLAAVKIQERKLYTQLVQMEEQKENIQEQELLIKKQNAEVEENLNILEQLKADREEQEELIEGQKNELNVKEGLIKTQKKSLIMLIAVVGLILFMSFFIYRSYRIKKKINIQLEEKNVAIQKQNIEIQKQKEELKNQANELSKINIELEKLSIVASETDNAVIIMDAMANFEWINEGFTRLYGYDLEQMKHQFGTNLKTSSKKQNISNIIDECISKKRSVSYENSYVKKDGETQWVHTTLTPILDEYGKIDKLVAIDSDISRLKEAELEIHHKNEELVSQRDELAAQKDYIEFQNQHIKSSINYAKTIQSAILPLNEEINKFYESFIIYKPKDIVSGDFYWFTTYEHENVKLNFVAVVDCTGHGVPGAFMSMIASRLLNEIVLERQIISTKDILTKLNEAVRKALRQDKTDNSDGMDLCLCRMEEKNNTTYVTYTGAKRPLYHYNKNENTLNILKADRKSVGGYLSKRSSQIFTNQQIILNKGDVIYLTTDGYIDQNNKERVRLGTPRFKEFVKEIMHKDLNFQLKFLEDKLERWQEGNEQRDDITILALKIK